MADQKFAEGTAPPPAYPGPPQGQYPPPQGQYPPPQGQYPPPQGQYPPPQGQYPPPQGQYPPPQGQYPPPQGQYPPPQGQYPAQPAGAVVVTQPASTTVVLTGNVCGNCRVGVIQEDFTVCGIILAICFFPLGVLCCWLMRERKCTNCGRTY